MTDGKDGLRAKLEALLEDDERRAKEAAGSMTDAAGSMTDAAGSVSGREGSMTVAELIVHLQGLPADAIVLVPEPTAHRDSLAMTAAETAVACRAFRDTSTGKLLYRPTWWGTDYLSGANQHEERSDTSDSRQCVQSKDARGKRIVMGYANCIMIGCEEPVDSTVRRRTRKP